MKTNLKYFYENFPVIESDNLILREIIEDDLKDIAVFTRDPEIYKYWGDNMSTLEKNVGSYYERFIKRTPGEKRNVFHWGIALKNENRIIGQIFLKDIQNNRIGSIGYRIARDYWGKGIMTEAVKTVIKFCFTQTELKRLEASAQKENIASNKVLEKSGFTQEGFIRQGKYGRKYCDYYKYGFIKSDYKK